MATSPRNSYTTPAQFLRWTTPIDTDPDWGDDTVIASIMEAVARYMDAQCNRVFFPFVETKSFDVPDERGLYLDDDLLEIISITNGDGDTVTSTYYNLIPANIYPKDEIRIKEGSAVTWVNSDTETEQVIDVLAIWGYRERYTVEGWTTGGTLGAAITTTTALTITPTAGHTLEAGHIIKIDNEIMIVDTTSSASIALLRRGDNGSTAATHTNGTTMYIWNPQPDIALAHRQISQNVYRRFSGSNASADENIVTASGVIITPRDVPVIAKQTLSRYRKIY